MFAPSLVQEDEAVTTTVGIFSTPCSCAQGVLSNPQDCQEHCRPHQSRRHLQGLMLAEALNHRTAGIQGFPKPGLESHL